MPIQTFSINALLEVIRDSEKICKYVDIPFQHVSQSFLRRMRRGQERQRSARSRGETPRRNSRTDAENIVDCRDFQARRKPISKSFWTLSKTAQFERLGVFKYSDEEGTAAARMTRQVSEEEKERRWQEMMELQSSISRKKNEALIGTIQRVMIDEVDHETEKVSRPHTSSRS